MKNYLMLIFIFMGFIANAQSGKASFIGDSFHGLKMANTETYDKNTLVGAHRKFAYGTKVKVTNTNNGKSVIVTIKDRGPFVRTEIIALSRKAGEAIGMVYDKTVAVRIEVVGAGATSIVTEEEPVARSTSGNTTKGANTPSSYEKKTVKPTPPAKPKAKPTPKPKATVKTTAKPKAKPKAKTATASAGTAKATSKNTGVYKIDIQSVERGGYGVQIGVFSDINTVIYKVKQLKSKGFNDVYYVKNGANYKIIISNYPTQAQATAYKNALKKKYGINGFVVAFAGL